MFLGIPISLLLILTQLKQITCASLQPCPPKIFSYELEGRENDGNNVSVAVKRKEESDGVWLGIMLTKPQAILEIKIKKTNGIYKNQNSRIQIIKLNGETICAENNALTSTSSGLFKDHIDIPFETNPDRVSSVLPSPSHEQKISCGKVATRSTGLITHGQNTEAGDWPWHAALFRITNGNLNYICGGSLVSESHVLTAAHCVTKFKRNMPVPPEEVIVYLGKFSLKTFDSSVQTKDISKILVHPRYNNSFFHHDIALIKFDTPATLNRYVRPVCFWDDNFSIENQLGTVIGWGIDENSVISDSLKKAQMPVVSTESCIFSNKDFYSLFLNQHSFCAGFKNGTSVCNGDSGGGMVFPKSNTQGQGTIWQIRGIVSVAVVLQGVCDTSQYVVFTDVSKHLEWIKATII